jgi:hypothetical protein
LEKPDDAPALAIRLQSIVENSVLPSSYVPVVNVEQPDPDSIPTITEETFAWFRIMPPSKFFRREKFSTALALALLNHPFTDPVADQSATDEILRIWSLASHDLEIPDNHHAFNSPLKVFNQLFTFRNIIINASSAEETLLASIQNTAVANERLRQAGLSSALKAAEAREREQERIRVGEATASHIHLNQFMATSLLAEKSETMAREQRKDPYTACSI